MLINPLDSNAVIRSLEKTLDIASLKQKVSASNIANIDTPGYIAKKMDFREVLNRELENSNYPMLSMRKTSGKHISPSGDSISLSVEEDDETIPKNDGNNVNLDKEIMELTEANSVFKVTSRFLIDKIRMIKYTLREGR